MKKIFEDFSHLYSVSKTLRFGLRPHGETADKIADFKNQAIKSVVVKDEILADNYKKAKKIIDQLHKEFIDRVLSRSDVLSPSDIQRYYKMYVKLKKLYGKDQEEKQAERNDLWKTRIALEKELREIISCKFKNEDDYIKTIKERKKLPEHVVNWLKEKVRKGEISDTEYEENKECIEKFKNFTNYFSGFAQSRDNLYSNKNQVTAISNRIISENLPRFFG